MSTKDWIAYSDVRTGLFQEISSNQENNNSATIEIKNPSDFIIESDSYRDGTVMSLLRVSIPAQRFDELAVAWLKHRKLLASNRLT
jgi:hypothetical protein